MSDTEELERHLRDVLRDRAAGVSVPLGLAERLVDRGTRTVAAPPVSERDRPHRRWAPVAIAAAAGVFVTVGVVATRVEIFGGSSPAHPRPVVVPWDPTAQQPVTTRQYPSLVVGTVAAPEGLRPCTNLDLRLVSAHSHPGSFDKGWMETEFVLQSISATSCSVSTYGIPTDLTDQQGRLIPNDTRALGGGMRIPQAWLLRPGQLVAASAGWAHVRGQGPEPAALVILPGNDVSPVPDARLSVSLKGVDAPPDPVNPSNVGPWRTGWGWADVNSIADEGSLTSLTATLTAPESVSRGAIVPLTVDLANHTRHAVDLVPCPTVLLTLTVVPIKVGVTSGTRGPLNCAAAPRSIGPGASVRFTAEVAARDVPSGGGLVVWTLTSAGRTLVTAWHTVTVRP
jgi:hypothetical protein